VGDAVALDLVPPPEAERAASVTSFVVVSWNVWVGRGRLLELVERLAAGEWGMPAGMPVVLLVQEALRRDNSVPERSNGFAPRELFTRVGPRQDIAEVTRRLGWNLRYIPSMRNGAERSDRGNAILTPLPLGPATAIELPLVWQRRVAVGAAVTIAGRPIRLLSTHLDPRGPAGYKWLGAAGRGLQAAHLLADVEDPTVILGADLNLGRGRAERAWRLLMEGGFESGVPPEPLTWPHTYHALPRLVLDYILFRNQARAIRSARVWRVDENPGDRGRDVLGSDHHPLLARIDLAT
jgi:endonuclease/exonuclease/phosphatase family metal-dependent hydrolase